MPISALLLRDSDHAASSACTCASVGASGKWSRKYSHSCVFQSPPGSAAALSDPSRKPARAASMAVKAGTAGRRALSGSPGAYTHCST